MVSHWACIRSHSIGSSQAWVTLFTTSGRWERIRWPVCWLDIRSSEGDMDIATCIRQSTHLGSEFTQAQEVGKKERKRRATSFPYKIH